MDVIVEVHCIQAPFELDALVDILAGNPFIVRNDIGVLLPTVKLWLEDRKRGPLWTPSRHTAQPAVRNRVRTGNGNP